MPLTLKISEQERAQRLIDVRESLASVRLEGLEPGPEAMGIFERYADGHITLEQLGLEIDALHDRDYGPVPIPWNGRSLNAPHFSGRNQRRPSISRGNGRTQREFIRQLAQQAGFTLHWSGATRDQMTAASRDSFLTGNITGECLQ